MKLDDLKDLNTAELSCHLQDMAKSVLDAKDKYYDLLKEQRLYTAARELHTDGIWIGDTVRTAETGKRLYRVELSDTSHVQLQPLGKTTSPAVMLWEVGGIERVG